MNLKPEQAEGDVKSEEEAKEPEGAKPEEAALEPEEAKSEEVASEPEEVKSEKESLETINTAETAENEVVSSEEVEEEITSQEVEVTKAQQESSPQMQADIAFARLLQQAKETHSRIQKLPKQDTVKAEDQ